MTQFAEWCAGGFSTRWAQYPASDHCAAVLGTVMIAHRDGWPIDRPLRPHHEVSVRNPYGTHPTVVERVFMVPGTSRWSLSDARWCVAIMGAIHDITIQVLVSDVPQWANLPPSFQSEVVNSAIASAGPRKAPDA